MNYIIPTVKGLLFAVFFGFALSAAITFITSAIHVSGNGYLANDQSYISIIIIFPVMEELIFRKFLFGYILFQKLNIPPMYSAAVTGVIFSALHEPLPVMVWAFIFSCISCFVYFSTKTIIIPMIIHISFNGFSVMLSMIPESFQSAAVFISGAFIFITFITGIILLRTKGKVGIREMLSGLSRKTERAHKHIFREIITYPFRKEIEDWKEIRNRINGPKGN